MSGTPLAIAPFVALSGGVFGTYLVGRSPRGRSVAWAGVVASVAVLLASGTTWLLWLRSLPIEYALFGEGVGVRVTALSVFLSTVACLVGLAVIVHAAGSTDSKDAPELYYPLVLATLAGVVGIGLSADLFSLYVFFEVMAVGTYALVPFAVDRATAVEAGLKYVIMNAAGSLLAIFGISLVYAHTGGVLDFATLSGELAATTGPGPLEAAVLFLVVGFGVKAAVVPLHTWLPDAYTESPASASALLAALATPAAIVAMGKALAVVPDGVSVGLLLLVVGALTMTVGNFLALGQRDLKRLLAYSSIPHVGYILFGLGVGFYGGFGIAFDGALFHVLANAFMKGGAFLAVGAIAYRLAGAEGKHRTLGALAGVGYQMPVAAGAIAVAVLALAGVPPLAGFWGKLFIVLGSAEVSGAVGVGLAILVIGNSFLSLGYYLPVLGALFDSPTDAVSSLDRTPTLLAIPILALTGGTILLGLAPAFGLDLVGPAADVLQHGLEVTP
ncbi:complex I subunit 5 family protein [Halorhabdus sp. CUG00001]|uniref:complex I subunit 5 family protein n=1 Tax=Halorhabdus sp. CUG00001 TaxID=2600297 RepID=UPI00131C2669|nr:proton-conducting transporter membrane subunit [Halorhabdus sp. CUG00001]